MNLFGNIFPYGKFGSSRAINGENPTGEKGKGGMASGSLGKGRKGHPCLTDIAPGSSENSCSICSCSIVNFSATAFFSMRYSVFVICPAE